MAEMLPCTLSLSRYNPTFRLNEEGNNSDGNDESENDGDYLDPSKDSDYELISKLRYGLMKGSSVGEDEDNYSELQDLDYESSANNKASGIELQCKQAPNNTMSVGTSKMINDTSSRCTNSTTNGRPHYR